MLSFAGKVYRKMHGGIDAIKCDRLKSNFSSCIAVLGDKIQRNLRGIKQ